MGQYVFATIPYTLPFDLKLYPDTAVTIKGLPDDDSEIPCTVTLTECTAEVIDVKINDPLSGRFSLRIHTRNRTASLLTFAFDAEYLTHQLMERVDKVIFQLPRIT